MKRIILAALVGVLVRWRRWNRISSVSELLNNTDSVFV